MVIKAILFDLDGTILDSIPLHKKSFQLLFRHLGGRLPMSEVNEYIHWSTDEMYHKFRVKERLGLDLSKFLEVRRKEYYALIRGKNLAFQDRFLLAKRLKKKYQLALVTNSSVLTTKRSTPKAVLDLFDAIVTYSDVLHGKPSPDMLLLAAKRMGIKPSKCVMVGDSIVDMKAAKEAKMASIAWHCKTAASSLAELKKSHPTRIVHNVKEFEHFLESFSI